MTIGEAQRYARQRLEEHYEPREAGNIMHLLLEKLTGLQKTDRLLAKERPLLPEQMTQLANWLEQLAAARPVQYVIGEAWFSGICLKVNPAVLIPRPETEELVDWAVQDCRQANIRGPKVLDIGTGSGCIAIAFQKKIPGSETLAIDISDDALLCAKNNALIHDTPVRFQRLDFLAAPERGRLPVCDLILSNPPYIPAAEKVNMSPRVWQQEPASALFVPDHDPLLFYRNIATFGKTHLAKAGAIYLELYEELGEPTAQLFRQEGYMTWLRKDMQGKDRILKAVFT
ncbi:MAG TPA: peptide chain release factor N(5)-glutamine methyltransferase [Sediminibacterium sp.]|nr:peptide chain release factor N(5)-glutamine methyltransferase [Sediminibacterium sp.]